MKSDLELLRLLQLCSATLPVGAYAFSQGLEYAIEQQWLKDQSDSKQWLSLSLSHSLAKTDIPILIRLINTYEQQDVTKFVYWNNYLLACRESKELRLTDTAMGEALKRLLSSLGMESAFFPLKEASFAAGFSIATHQWHISIEAALKGYLWSWLESQVTAVMKLLPLGQSNAQQLLFELAAQIPDAIRTAFTINDENIGASMPGLSMASAWHENQYSRLYRS